MCIRDSTYTVTQAQPEGFDDGIDNGDSSFTISNDQFSDIQLGFGEAFTSNTFAERLPGASGNPPRLPGLPPIARSPISSLLNSFAGSPGPIYSGVPITGNGNPLSLDSGRPVTGGFAAGNGTGNGFVQGGDCGCPEPINPCCEPIDPCGQADPYSSDGSIGFGQLTPQGQAPGGEFVSGPPVVEGVSESTDAVATGEIVEVPAESIPVQGVSVERTDTESDEDAKTDDQSLRYDAAENLSLIHI